MLSAALSYEQRGWSVVPIHRPIRALDGSWTCSCGCGIMNCKDAGKHPAVDSWVTYQARRAGAAELEGWFGRGLRTPMEERNIAVICGQVSGGLLVLDCDDRTTYNALAYQYPGLGRTLRATTGRGVHVYLHADQPVRTTKFTANGATHHLKAEGSYVVAPPSLHQSGRTYEWIDPDAQILTVNLQQLRRAILRIGRQAQVSHESRESGWAARLFASGVKLGERDERTTELVGYMVRIGVPYDMIEEILALWTEHRVEQRAGDSFGRPQISRIIRSIEGKERRRS